MSKLATLLESGHRVEKGYNFAFLDEFTKREIRRNILKAVAIPGYQVPFGSRDMPLARGWGTGGIQITLSIVGEDDTLKVIDQGCDDSVNALNIKNLVNRMTGAKTTEDVRGADIIQTRHRIPEETMTEDQILVLQVPEPEPLRKIEPREYETRRMHAQKDYSAMWLHLYEDIVRHNQISISSCYPVMVNGRFIMDTTPIPRWDVPKLHECETLNIFCAGREKRIYVIPPYTNVEPLEFDDYGFSVEDFTGKCCERCGSSDTYLDEIIDDDTGVKRYLCSDTSYCEKIQGGEI
ncbi:MAG: alpha-D-ribose 1-methylphosphonate 5-phosphate lyase [Methanolobus sp.]|nr:alpha-D-ribose 1-methylphosphonate 5-phosphate lyase [Methanolobus sp.]